MPFSRAARPTFVDGGSEKWAPSPAGCRPKLGRYPLHGASMPNPWVAPPTPWAAPPAKLGRHGSADLLGNSVDGSAGPLWAGRLRRLCERLRRSCGGCADALTLRRRLGRRRRPPSFWAAPPAPPARRASLPTWLRRPLGRRRRPRRRLGQLCRPIGADAVGELRRLSADTLGGSAHLLGDPVGSLH